ncbi:biotin--[acetyl-CoA-carboxylase] ligase [Roseobacter weihaiensis]|uniref:biotin--[acetyl-CoA-carboxylase] ligase n=1 Tax=Roseobacter weihaiensis TaxID=2763262 RepID=UPI001D0A26C9|nr:biotin--[acetyl-CoA-carboxylase] ligase [Roseobacter sp. H9]
MTGWPEGYGRIVLSSVSSTLDEALGRATDQPVPFWLLAHHQTAPRGRRGRPWSMLAGNFAATLMQPAAPTPALSALRSFVMSLALHRAFVEVTGQPQAFALKWPNDVLLNGGKVAGILLESSGSTGALAIGVGVNLAAAPAPQAVEPGAAVPVSLAAETGCVVTPERFLDILAQHYAVLDAQFDTYGFAPIRTAWLAHAARLGETITARTSKDTHVGIFEDVDATGQLVIRGPRGVKTIAAADVYF